MNPGRPLDELRDDARRLPREVFAARFPDPVLLAIATLEGDLQFADADAPAAVPRVGNTLVHVPRLSAEERLERMPRGRTPVAAPWFWSLTPPPTGPVLSLGRLRGNQLRILDWTVSGAHARIHVVRGTARASVEDAGSRNGTLHNGARLREGVAVELISGDELQIGRWFFVFLDPLDFHRVLVGELSVG